MGEGKPRAVIIGAGVAGLAAAMRLAERGSHAAKAIEADAEPGGLARSLHFKGVSTDLGPHRLHTELPEVEALISDVCAPSLYTVRRTSRIFLRGQFLTYPPSPLNVAARLGPWRMAKFGASMAIEKSRPAARPETYESIMRHAFGPALYKFMLRPYSEKVWKTNPAEIHADTARLRVSAGSFAKMVARLFRRERRGAETALREFRYVRGGIETMVRHLTERARAVGAEVELGRPVAGIELEEPTPGRMRASGVRLASGEVLPAEAVISTAPLPDLLGDLLPLCPELAGARAAAQGLVYLGIIFVLLIVRRKIISGDNWLYFPEKEFVFNRAYESKSFDPAMGPEDKSVLCVEITTRPGSALERESDANLIAETIRQMARTGLFRADEVEEGMVHRLRHGYPLYGLDYKERLDRALEGLLAIPNLLTIGRQGLFNHNNTDHSILMGLRAAETLATESAASPAERWLAAQEEFRGFRIVD